MSQSCLCSGREGLRVAENISLGEKMSEGCSTQNNHWNNFQIGFRCYTSCDCPSFGSPSSEHVFQKLTKINPRNFSLSPITRLVVGSISPFKKMCLSKRRETVHLSRACNKLCKKFNSHRFAALRNCSWVSVANESLPWQSCIHIEISIIMVMRLMTPCFPPIKTINHLQVHLTCPQVWGFTSLSFSLRSLGVKEGI